MSAFKKMMLNAPWEDKIENKKYSKGPKIELQCNYTAITYPYTGCLESDLRRSFTDKPLI